MDAVAGLEFRYEDVRDCMVRETWHSMDAVLCLGQALLPSARLFLDRVRLQVQSGEVPSNYDYY